MKRFGRRDTLIVAFTFLVVGIVWFLTDRTGLGVAFLALGVVFLTLDPQQRNGPDR